MKTLRAILPFLILLVVFMALPPSQVLAQTGIRTTITPPEAAQAGAQWRLPALWISGGWQNSGDTQIGIEPNDYIIEYSDIAGWIKPNNQIITITENNILEHVSPPYVQIGEGEGFVQIFIGPQDARAAGASWRFVGDDDWLESGDVQTQNAGVTRTIEFKEISGWIAPENQDVTFLAETTITRTVLYQATGSLNVTISPPEAISAGARWRFTNPPTGFPVRWYTSGETVSNLAPGNYDIEFRDIDRWITPASQTVTVESAKTTFASGAYVRSTGVLHVTIEPPSLASPATLVQNRGQWRRLGTTAWLNSGTDETGIAPGVYTVEFKPVPNWIKPDNVQVTVSTENTSYVSGIYVLATDQGALQGVLQPEFASVRGAAWRRIGTTEWMPSGHVEIGFPEGIYNVEFKPVAGFSTPGNRAVQMRRGHLTSFTGIYGVQNPGALQIILEPDAARSLGGAWRRVGTQTWLPSGQVEQGLPEGSYAVEFKPIFGSQTPEPRTIFVAGGGTTTVSVTYVGSDGLGALQVFIEPEPARNLGAGWRLAGVFEEWLSSGETRWGLPEGRYWLEFRPIEKWMEPLRAEMYIFSGEVSSLTRIYTLEEWQSEIGLINNSNQQVTATVRARDNAGWLDPVTITLRPYGRTELVSDPNVATPELPSSVLGYAVLETTSKNIVGYAKFSIPGWYRAAYPMLPSPSATTRHFPHIASTSEWFTGFSLANPATQTRTPKLLFNNPGETARDLSLPANSHYHEFFQGLVDEESATLTNAASIVGVQILGGMTTPQLAAVSLTEKVSKRLVFPHIPQNADWWTGLAIYNPTTTTAELTLSSYDADGTLLQTTGLSIPAKGKLAKSPQGLNLPANTQWLNVSSGTDLAGLLLLGTVDQQGLAGISVTDMGGSQGVFPKLDKDGYTGIVLVNPNSEPAVVVLEAVTNAGQVVARANLTLAANGKKVGLAENLFDSNQDLREANYVRYTANRELWGFQLNGSGDGRMLDGLPALMNLPTTSAATQYFYFPHLQAGD